MTMKSCCPLRTRKSQAARGDHDLRYLCTTSHPQYGQSRQSVRIGQEPVLRSDAGGLTRCHTFPTERAATLTTSPRTGGVTKRTCLFTPAPPRPEHSTLGGQHPTLGAEMSVHQVRESSLRDTSGGNVRRRGAPLVRPTARATVSSIRLIRCKTIFRLSSFHLRAVRP
jgi:hypothetical protein